MSCPYAFTSSTSSTSEQEEKAQDANNNNNSSEFQLSPVASSPPQDGTLTAIQALQLAKSSCPAFQSACPFRNVQDAHSMRKALEKLPPSHILAQRDMNTAGSSTNSDSNSKSDDNNNSNDKIDKVGKDKSESDPVKKRSGSESSIEIHQSLRVALQHVHDVSQSLKSMSSNEDENEEENQNPHMMERTKNNNSKHSSLRSMSSGSTFSTGTDKYEISGGICPYKTIANSTSEEQFVNVMEDFSFNAILARLIHNQKTSSQQSNPTLATDTDKDTNTLPSSSTIENVPPTAPSTTNKESKMTRRNSSLSTSLKQGTAKSHASAESVHFVKEFIKGNIDQTLYSTLLSNLYWVYHTMETELDKHAPMEFPTLHKPELYRKDSLQDDLEFFFPDIDFDHYNTNDEMAQERLEMKIPPSQATKDYIHRIEYIAGKEPLLLLSHAYTRYLGDLSGGKVLARVAKRALNLKSKSDNSNSNSSSNNNNDEPCDGLAFYHFAEIESAKKFKDEYRSALDNLDFLSMDQIERLVAEANVAFVLNMRIFEELDVLGGVQNVSVRDYSEATCYYEDCISDQLERKKNGGSVKEREDMEDDLEKIECPFAKLGGPNPHTLMDNFTSSHDETHQTKKKDDNSSTLKKNKQHEGERCPWPFVFFHDPKTGFQDWQTWFVIGIVLCWTWSLINP